MQRVVLRVGEWHVVAAFKFDADGEIVAARPALPTGQPCVPGALQTGYELDDMPVATDVEMRRHATFRDGLIIRVGGAVQRVGEQSLHAIPAEFVRRQTDVVDHQQVYVAHFACIEVGRRQLFAAHPPPTSINPHRYDRPGF